ncbi:MULTISPECIES: LysR family transcriptional regulator [Kordiimonas]|uniref:LysR family transcriptional regulator n=1 Tax=Kordiimonas TaxID=288021 RepID=UPI001FF55978|nr:MULTISPECIES: LysR family transcriptional regulator [Kordiimonas]MCK0067898.1 LysR family transcriptional regulator [Kordiimonas laminariae]UTW60125.1 LysR family transcriptional regulator [Kordiimonas sp. SCSIO 12603]
MDWDRLRIFHTVAESGSFTNAGARLNCSQSAVSRQIRALEESLNVSLFTRHARGLVLTQEGQELFNTARDVVHRIEETERSLMESKERPSGLLRVTTMVTFGAVWLTPHLEQFMAEYPDIDVQVILDDADLDLAAGEADVAIRLHDPEQADLIQRPLASFHTHIYASPEYLDRMGTPVTPEDLDNHDLITFGTTNLPTLKNLGWLANVGNPTKKRKPRLQVNNLYGVMHAVEAGMGIAVLPDYLVHNRQTLVRVLPQIEGKPFNSYYCYPPELRGSLRVALFRDFMVRQIKAESNIL